MCWYSADHAKEILEAEAGQRLGIRKVHGCNWVVRESDLHKQSPTPVCLIDGATCPIGPQSHPNHHLW